MSRMAELDMRCTELSAMMEDGSIDLDEAVEMLCEDYTCMDYTTAMHYMRCYWVCAGDI